MVKGMKVVLDPRAGTCRYCGSGPGEACVVTLAPEVGPLSVEWAHRSRSERMVERG